MVNAKCFFTLHYRKVEIMKKILLSVFTLFGFGMCFGQSFTMPNDTAVHNYPSGGADLKVSNNITNTSGDTLRNLQWRNIAMSTIPTGWDFVGVCDNFTCWGTPDVVSGDPHMYAPFAANTVAGHYMSVNIDASAANGSYLWVRNEIKNLDDNYTKVVTLIATKNGTSGVSTIISEDDITIFPNPAKSAVNVLYDAKLGIKNIGVYNLIGKMVSIYKVGANSAKLDIEELPAGIYFLRMYNTQGKVVATRKFTHQ